MASVYSLSTLIKFIRRPEWEDDFAEILGQHLGPACSNNDVDPDNLFDILVRSRRHFCTAGHGGEGW